MFEKLKVRAPAPLNGSRRTDHPRGGVDSDSLIIAVPCLIDDALRQAAPERPRLRGQRSALRDAGVPCIEVGSEHLSFDRGLGVFGYFRRHRGRGVEMPAPFRKAEGDLTPRRGRRPTSIR